VSVGEPRVSVGEPRVSVGEPRVSVGEPRVSEGERGRAAYGMNSLSLSQKIAMKL
jgi:hypothetical protein